MNENFRLAFNGHEVIGIWALLIVIAFLLSIFLSGFISGIFISKDALFLMKEKLDKMGKK
jgi:hypothetical protein